METERGHLSIETLARWLAGDLPQDDVVREIAPHLEASCAACGERFAELRALQEEVGHWNESIVLFEGREAPGLLAQLEPLDLASQLDRVEKDGSFRSWALCSLLLRESKRAVVEQPVRAVERAELAVRIAEQLSGEVYDSVWVHDLTARAWGHLANSRRVLGELMGADQALRTAFALIERGGTGAPEVRGELLHVQAALRRAQRRLPEALDAADDAMVLFHEARAAAAMRRVRLTRAKIREEMGDLDGTLAELEGLIDEFDALDAIPSGDTKPPDLSTDPGLPAVSSRAADPGRPLDVEADGLSKTYAHYNLLFAMVAVGRFDEASRRLAQIRDAFVLSSPVDRIRLRWLEARIAAGLGHEDEAESVLLEVRAEFYEHRMGYDAALATLELATLYAQQRRSAEIKQLAIEILPLFESREVHREALGALILFQRAAEQENLTVELARQVLAFLARERSLGF